jgi:hypothetical protein
MQKLLGKLEKQSMLHGEQILQVWKSRMTTDGVPADMWCVMLAGN